MPWTIFKDALPGGPRAYTVNGRIRETAGTKGNGERGADLKDARGHEYEKG